MEFIVSTCIAAFSLLITMFKHIHERAESRRNTEFDQFCQIIDRVSGRFPDGNLMVDIQQIAAVYQLIEFKRFKHISLPILEHYLDKMSDDDNPGFKSAVENVYKELCNDPDRWYRRLYHLIFH